MKRVCRILTGAFALFWVLALAVLAIGTFGWLGQDRDPLSAVYLVILGLPWNRYIEGSSPIAMAMLVLAPAINLFALALICRLLARVR